MAKLKQALGKAITSAAFLGETYSDELVCDLYDVGDIEDALGIAMEAFVPSNARHQLALIWAVVRKKDARVTAEMRERGEYPLTLAEVRKRITLGVRLSAEYVQFVYAILVASGVVRESGSAEESDAANAPEPDAGNATAASH